MLAIEKKIMENVDWRHLTTGSSGLTGQARSQLNRMLSRRFAPEEIGVRTSGRRTPGIQLKYI